MSFLMSFLILQDRCTCMLLHTHSTLHTMNLLLPASVIFHPISVHPHRLSMTAKWKMHVRPTIQRCLCKTNKLPQKDFHLMCVPKISSHNFRAYHSYCRTSQLRRQRWHDKMIINQARTWTFAFSHMSCQSRSWSSISHSLYVLVMSVPLSVTA